MTNQEIESKLENLSLKVESAKRDYSNFLTEQGYKVYSTGGELDTQYWEIHPDYYEAWKEDKYQEMIFPWWAVIYLGTSF